METPLSNSRHEQFARALAEGRSQADAYSRAGYAVRTVQARDVNACRLLRNARVASRVLQLKAQGAARTAITVETLIGEADQLQKLATAMGNIAAAVAALTVKAKLSGFWIDRAENKNTNVCYTISDKLMSEDQWAAERAERLIEQ